MTAAVSRPRKGLKPSTARTYAAKYIGKGWSPIPVLYREKKPTISEWTNLRIDAGNLDEHFPTTKRRNVGVILGEASNGLVDVDCDSREAVKLARHFLPLTSLEFGRKSKPRSHHLYRCPGAKTRQFRLPKAGATARTSSNSGHRMIVELRSTGVQTVFPGSTHESGEEVRWYTCKADERKWPDREPTECHPEQLLRCVSELAAASLLVRKWGKLGDKRGSTALALIGMMLQSNFDSQRVEQFVEIIASEAADDHVERHVRAVKNTAAKIKNGEPIAGGQQLAELLGGRSFDAITRWLNLERDPRPRIIFKGGDLPHVVDQAELALLAMPGCDIYQRGGILMRPVRTRAGDARGGVVREEGSLTLIEVSTAYLVETLTRAARWTKFDGRSNRSKSIDCPSRFADTYKARKGEWRVPELMGLLEVPTLRYDGTILSTEGYDASTGLYFSFDKEFPPIPEEPTKGDAASALKSLKRPLAEFPFQSDADRSVALAAILTAPIRLSLRSAPMFGFSAPVMGSGKSLLADIVSLIATGRPAPTVSQPRSGEEDQKVLLSFLIAGDPVICIDNVERHLKSDALATILTQQTYQGRILGVSKMAKLPTNATFLATGNNLTFAGDLSTRALTCSLDPECEHPEQREFKRTDLRQWVLKRRPKLAVAALTILRAYHFTGRPKQNIKQFGRFEEWSDWVRSALVWLGEADPCETRKTIESTDPERQALSVVLEMWWRKYTNKPKTASKVIAEIEATCERDQVLTNNALAQALREAVGDDRGAYNSKRLGKWLSKYKDRIVDGKKFRLVNQRQGISRWRVEAVREK